MASGIHGDNQAASSTPLTPESAALHDLAPVEPRTLSRTWSIAIIAATAAALSLKLFLALKTYGTNDVYRYEEFVAASRFFGAFIYRATWDFNHPPSMIHVLRLMGWLSNVTGLSFPFWLRLPGILADAGSVWVLWKILGPRLRETSMRLALLMFAVAPPFLLVAGFHGNTDTIMIFFLLLSVYLNEKDTDTALAGAIFGLSMCFKVVPVITVPVMFFYLRNPKKQLTFFAAVGGVLLIAWSPYIFQDTRVILGQIFGYRSYYGHWGLSYLAVHLAQRLPEWAWLSDLFRKVGAYCLLAAIAGASFWMNRLSNRPRLYLQVGVVFFLFLSFTNAFGVQYLAWLVPWVVGLGALPTAIYLTASGVFLFLAYNYWSQGIPWYMADSLRIGDFQGHLDYFQIACWLSVLVILVFACEQIITSAARERSPSFRRAILILQAATAAALLLFLVYPAIRQARSDTKPIPWPVRQNLALFVRSTQFSDLSFQLYRMGRYQDAITAAQQSVALNPASAVAYTDIAASYAELHLWDQSIPYAQQAYRLQPNSQLAKNNLNWVLQEKRKASGAPASASSRTAQDFLNLSLQDYQAGRFKECIVNAKEAVKLQPDMAEAYNNMAACNSSLSKWDDAIRAAEEAVRLKPDFQLAKNNLAWAMQQKRSQSDHK